VSVTVSLSVHAVEGKWLELSTPKLVEMACIDPEVKRSKVTDL